MYWNSFGKGALFSLLQIGANICEIYTLISSNTLKIMMTQTKDTSNTKTYNSIKTMTIHRVQEDNLNDSLGLREDGSPL